MINVADGIVDFTFKMDDETGITIGTDLVKYVTDYDREYSLNWEIQMQLLILIGV